MRVLRAICGALAGYVIFAGTAVALGAMTGRNLHAPQPIWFIVVTAAYGVLFAALGGLLADRIAPHRRWAVTGMTLLIGLGAAASLIASPREDARWSQWCALLLMAPGAYLASRLIGKGNREMSR